MANKHYITLRAVPFKMCVCGGGGGGGGGREEVSDLGSEFGRGGGFLIYSQFEGGGGGIREPCQ